METPQHSLTSQCNIEKYASKLAHLETKMMKVRAKLGQSVAPPQPSPLKGKARRTPNERTTKISAFCADYKQKSGKGINCIEAARIMTEQGLLQPKKKISSVQSQSACTPSGSTPPDQSGQSGNCNEHIILAREHSVAP